MHLPAEGAYSSKLLLIFCLTGSQILPSLWGVENNLFQQSLKNKFPIPTILNHSTHAWTTCVMAFYTQMTNEIVVPDPWI